MKPAFCRNSIQPSNLHYDTNLSQNGPIRPFAAPFDLMRPLCDPILPPVETPLAARMRRRHARGVGQFATATERRPPRGCERLCLSELT
jgi:hypothetical protein